MKTYLLFETSKESLFSQHSALYGMYVDKMSIPSLLRLYSFQEQGKAVANKLPIEVALITTIPLIFLYFRENQTNQPHLVLTESQKVNKNLLSSVSKFLGILLPSTYLVNYFTDLFYNNHNSSILRFSFCHLVDISE